MSGAGLESHLTMFKLPTRRLTISSLINIKVLISDKYFLFTEIFTISLQRIYVSIVVNKGFTLKGFTTYWMILVTSVNYQKRKKTSHLIDLFS